MEAVGEVRRRKKRQVSEPTSKKDEMGVERTSNEDEELEDWILTL